MSETSLDLSDGDVAEPFRFNFEIAWEVANKGGSSGPGARPLPGRAPASTRRDTGGREGELVDGWDSKVEGIGLGRSGFNEQFRVLAQGPPHC